MVSSPFGGIAESSGCGAGCEAEDVAQRGELGRDRRSGRASEARDGSATAFGTARRRAARTRRSRGAALRTTRYPPGRAGPGSTAARGQRAERWEPGARIRGLWSSPKRGRCRTEWKGWPPGGGRRTNAGRRRRADQREATADGGLGRDQGSGSGVGRRLGGCLEGRLGGFRAGIPLDF